MRAPAGLQTSGKRLWAKITAVFDLETDPDKAEILAQACRVADVIAVLEDAQTGAPLLVKGSMDQPVMSPFIPEVRVQRALLAQLLARLNFTEETY